MTAATTTGTEEAQQSAQQAWHFFDGPARYGAVLGDWATSTSDDGQPVTTARVHGRNADAALRRFAAAHTLVLGSPGDQHPVLAYTDTGIEITWRTGGVWVRLLAAS